MKTKILVALVFLLLAVLGGAAYGYWSKDQAEEASLKIIGIQAQEKAALALEVKALEDALAKKVSEGEALYQKIQESETRLVFLAGQLESQNNEIRQFSQSIKDLEDALAKKVSEGEALYQKIQENETRIVFLAGQLEGRQNKIGQLSQRIQNLEEELAKKKSELSEVSIRLEVLKGVNKILLKRTQEQEQQLISGESPYSKWLERRLQAESGFLALLHNYAVKTAAKNTDHAYEISPIYLVPTDAKLNPSRRVGIDMAMAVVQAWYSDRIDRTFKWTPTIVIQSPFPASYYRDPKEKGNILPAWDIIENQLDTLFPVGLPRLGSENRIYIVFLETGEFIDYGGWGWRYANGGGLALLGEYALNSISLSPDLLIDQAYGHSLIAHEIGHTLGLSHPDPSGDVTSIMGYNTTHFLNAEIKTEDRQILDRSPYLK